MVQMPGDSEPSLVQTLVESFHSLLDESLIVAIANDYNLDNPSEYESALAILEDIARSVPSEEATGFNPGGLPFSSEEQDDDMKCGATATPTSISEQASQGHRTDTSSTSHTCFSESGCSTPLVDVFNNESEEAKLQQLQGLFSNLKPFDVEYSLRKAKGDFQTALDDLLNVQYLQSTGQQAKGIDIFFDAEDGPADSRKKRRDKASADRGSKEGYSQASSSSYLDEFKDQSEIAYIAERLNISLDQVSEVYYEVADRSNAVTIIRLLDEHLSHVKLGSSSEAETTVMGNLRQKYRSIPDKYFQAIVEMTGIVSRFYEDIAALINKHFKRARKQRLDMSYNLTPLPDEELEQVQSSASGRRPAAAAASAAGCSWMASPAPARGNERLSRALQASETYNQARRDAAASAASLHRKGASNPLYRQAAGVYAERALEQAGYAQEAMSTAANILVEGQSTEDTIDLHGVSVQDGVRIARQKALAWWENQGKIRGERTRAWDLTIITGLGRHSVGGVSQLRRSVAAALLQDGWKIRVETGKFVITGRR